ncbi:MAG: hypothetical protein AB7E34_01495 [Acidaminococcaceae bacterium]
MTIGILLTGSFALLIRGVAWDPFCWFSGLKLLVWLALVSIWTNQFDQNSLVRRVFAGASEVVSLLVGSHLLVPYFWPIRFENGLYLIAFFVCTGLAWLYSLASYEKEDFGHSSYKLFFYLPVVVFIGSFLAVTAFAGPSYAAFLFAFYYLILGGLFLKEGLLFNLTGSFNFGLCLVALALAGLTIDFDYSKYLNWQLVNLFVCAIILINILFNIRKKKMRRKRK